MRILLAIAGVALLVASCSSDARDEVPTTSRTASTSSTAGPSPIAPNIVRIDQVPTVKRPDCATGRVVNIVPGHSGWPTLRRAAAGLLRHPGAGHAALTPARERPVAVLLYRRDHTVKATAYLRQLHDRWYPDSIAICRAD